MRAHFGVMGKDGGLVGMIPFELVGALKVEAPAYQGGAFGKAVADYRVRAAHTLNREEYDVAMHVIRVLGEAHDSDVKESSELLEESADWMTAMLVRFRKFFDKAECQQVEDLIRRAKGVDHA